MEDYRLDLTLHIRKQVRTLKMLHFQKHFSTSKCPCFLGFTSSAKLSDVTHVTWHIFGNFPFSCSHHHWDLMQVIELLKPFSSSSLGVTLPLTFKWPLRFTSLNAICSAWNSNRAEKHPSVAGISYVFKILSSLFGSFHASLSLGYRSQTANLFDTYSLNSQQQREKEN